MAKKPFFDLKVDGLDDLRKAFKKYADEIAGSTELTDGLVASGKDVATRAKQILNTNIYNRPPSPHYKRTGLLRARTTGDNKVSRTKEEITVNVVSKQHYAKYIEFGTSRMKALPFLAPALFALKKNILNRLSDSTIRYLKNRSSMK